MGIIMKILVFIAILLAVVKEFISNSDKDFWG